MRFIIFLSVFIFLSGCKQEQKVTIQKVQGNALGTTYSILYYASAEENKLEEPIFKQSLDSIFKVVNQSLSTYISTSDISKIKNTESSLGLLRILSPRTTNIDIKTIIPNTPVCSQVWKN